MDAEYLSFETQSMRAKLDAVRKEIAGLHRGQSLTLPVLEKLRDMADPEKHGGSPESYALLWELDMYIERATEGAAHGNHRA